MSRIILIKDEDCCIYVENEIPHYIEGAFIHCDIYQWSHSKVRKWKKKWANIARVMKDKGINDIYAIPPSEDEEKLIKMFGFKYTGLTFNGYKIMRYVWV